AFGVGRPARPAGGVEARLDSGHSQGQGVVAGGDSGPAVDADRPLERTQRGEPLPQGGLVEEGPLMDVAGGRGALRPGNVPGPRGLRSPARASSSTPSQAATASASMTGSEFGEMVM